MRCFISIDLPDSVKKEMNRVSDKIKSSKIIKGSFVDKKNLHLTLKFLGDLSEEQIKGVKKCLSDIILRRFDCHTGKTGVFPAPEYVKTIWIELNGDGVIQLKGLVDNKLNEVGINVDDKEFKSHITLARIRGVKEKDRFMAMLGDLGMKKMIFPVESFHLIKSELTREGPIYKVLEEFKLF